MNLSAAHFDLSTKDYPVNVPDWNQFKNSRGVLDVTKMPGWVKSPSAIWSDLQYAHLNDWYMGDPERIGVDPNPPWSEPAQVALEVLAYFADPRNAVPAETMNDDAADNYSSAEATLRATIAAMQKIGYQHLPSMGLSSYQGRMVPWLERVQGMGYPYTLIDGTWLGYNGAAENPMAGTIGVSYDDAFSRWFPTIWGLALGASFAGLIPGTTSLFSAIAEATAATPLASIAEIPEVYTTVSADLGLTAGEQAATSIVSNAVEPSWGVNIRPDGLTLNSEGLLQTADGNVIDPSLTQTPGVTTTPYTPPPPNYPVPLNPVFSLPNTPSTPNLPGQSTPPATPSIGEQAAKLLKDQALKFAASGASSLLRTLTNGTQTGTPRVPTVSYNPQTGLLQTVEPNTSIVPVALIVGLLLAFS